VLEIVATILRLFFYHDIGLLQLSRGNDVTAGFVVLPHFRCKIGRIYSGILRIGKSRCKAAVCLSWFQEGNIENSRKFNRKILRLNCG